MENESIAPTTLNFESDSEESPLKRNRTDRTPSPSGRLNFGSPPAGRLEFGSPPAGQLNFGFPLDINNEGKFVSTHYQCSPTIPVKSAGSLDKLYDFCSNLSNDGVLKTSPKPPQPPTSPEIGSGSFFSVHNGESPKMVQKIANIGSNVKANLDPTSSSRALMTKTDFLALLDAIRRSHGNPQVVKTYEMYFSHVSKDNGVLTLVQEECSPLPQNMAGLLSLIKCVVELHKSGLPVSDVKPANFMVSLDGRIVCVDLDLREPKKGVYKLVVSGEYTHTIGFDVAEQFKQLLLVFLETLGHPIVGDRKTAFRALYQQKGLLQSYGLLSSEYSVSETRIEDFCEVLQKIGLFEEDIAYLVGLIVPPASSQ